MASLDGSDHILVAAIDFGTTYSGYAFSFTSAPNKIRVNTNWKNNEGYASYKAPTSVLLTPEGRFEAFGFDAHKRYNELLVEDAADGYYLFDRFKMLLNPTQERELSTRTLLKAANGKSLPAVDVFSHTMRFLKKHMIQQIERKDRAFEILEEDILWVVTVPTIWDEAAKQFMRLAAEKAGLAAKDDRHRLRIALEPESASLFCLDIPGHFPRKLSANQPLNVAGTRYMVVDCGGGTTDITVHEVRPDRSIREIHCATGGPWGGTRVDENFYKVMDEIFGQEFMDRYRQQYPSEWLKMREAFDFKKRSSEPQVNLPIFYNFDKSHITMKKSEINESVEKSKWSKKGVTFSTRGYLCLTDKVMEELFHPVVARIVEHLECLMEIESLTNIEYFFLVGGFSESPILQKAIKDRFSPQICVVVPEEAGLAVMQGAVMFGHRPFSIGERISPKTFGMQCSLEYDAKKHSGGDYYLDGLRIVCPDAFFKFVEINKSISTKHGIRYRFRPSRSDQSKAEIRLYSTYAKDANLVTEDGMEHCGTAILSMPDIDHGKEREIEIVFFFGDTEVSVDAIDLTSNLKTSVTVNFLDDNLRSL